LPKEKPTAPLAAHQFAIHSETMGEVKPVKTLVRGLDIRKEFADSLGKIMCIPSPSDLLESEF